MTNPRELAVRRSRVARDVLHDRHEALADERDGYRVGADAVARGVVGVEEGRVVTLLAAVDAFLQEYRRCGDVNGAVEGDRVCDDQQARIEQDADRD